MSSAATAMALIEERLDKYLDLTPEQRRAFDADRLVPLPELHRLMVKAINGTIDCSESMPDTVARDRIRAGEKVPLRGFIEDPWKEP